MLTLFKNLFYKTFNSKYRILDIGIFVGYAIFTFLLVLRHEPYMDEAHCWLIARDSISIIHLIKLIPWTGQPILWNFILFPFAHLGFPFILQQLLTWVAAVLMVGIFVFRSPFPRFVKYAFVFSFWAIYEYVAVARNYGLTAALLFLVAVMYKDRFQKPILYAVFVALLFNSHFFMFFISSALVGVYAWEMIQDKKITKKTLMALSLMCLTGFFCFFTGTIFPEGHLQYKEIVIPNFTYPAEIFSRAFFPQEIFSSFSLSAISAGIILLISFFLLARMPIPFFILNVCFWGSWYISAFRFHEFGDRHCGLVLMQFIFVLWLTYLYKPMIVKTKFLQWINRISFKKIRILILILLALALGFSVQRSYLCARLDWQYPFSASRQMASFIKEMPEGVVANKIIVGFPPASMAPVSIYLPDWKFWYPDIEDFGTYYMLSSYRDSKKGMSPTEIIGTAGKRFGDLSKIFFLFPRPLEAKHAFGYEFYLVKAASPFLVGYGGEKYFLYKPVFVGPFNKNTVK